MTIYISHSSGFDYAHELYQPIKSSPMYAQHVFFLPHESENANTKSKDIIKSADVLVAEVSYPSTGQGIEIGWADMHNTPIVCLYRTGASYSNSLRFVTDNFISYDNSGSLMNAIQTVITSHQPN